MTTVRAQHYLFAHRALPALFHARPAEFIATLQREGDTFLRFLWQRVGKGLKESDRLAPEGLGYQVRESDGTTIALVALPTPLAATEAYYVALVQRAQTQNLVVSENPARLYTLEYGIGPEGQPQTFLCEWTPNRVHVNLGSGPEPTREAFLQTILKLIGGEAHA
jgi:hypothetical protein